MTVVDEAAAEYAAYFETLTHDSLDRLHVLCVPAVRFRDPFNEVTGVSAFGAVLRKMLDEVREARFAVTDRACSGQVCYMRWTFTFRGRKEPKRIVGVSEIHFDAAGRVTGHFDHWDSADVYCMVPVLGAAIRLVRRRLAARG